MYSGQKDFILDYVSFSTDCCSFNFDFSEDLKAWFKLKLNTIIQCLKRKFKPDVTETPEEEHVEETKIIRLQRTHEEISVSCIFSIITSFYQLKALITVQTMENENQSFIESIFNMRIVMDSKNEIKSVCPYNGVTPTEREFFMGFVSSIIMVFTITVVLIVCKVLQKGNSAKFYAGYYAVVAFCYKYLSRTSFTFINCKTLNKSKIFVHHRRSRLLHEMANCNVYISGFLGCAISIRSSFGISNDEKEKNALHGTS